MVIGIYCQNIFILSEQTKVFSSIFSLFLHPEKKAKQHRSKGFLLCVYAVLVVNSWKVQFWPKVLGALEKNSNQWTVTFEEGSRHWIFRVPQPPKAISTLKESTSTFCWGWGAEVDRNTTCWPALYWNSSHFIVAFQDVYKFCL